MQLVILFVVLLDVGNFCHQILVNELNIVLLSFPSAFIEVAHLCDVIWLQGGFLTLYIYFVNRVFRVANLATVVYVIVLNLERFVLILKIPKVRSHLIHAFTYNNYDFGKIIAII